MDVSRWSAFHVMAFGVKHTKRDAPVPHAALGSYQPPNTERSCPELRDCHAREHLA